MHIYYIDQNSSWTSRIKNELQCKYSTGKLFCWAAAINLPDYTNSPSFYLFPDFSLTLAEFPDISRFPEIPEMW